MRQLGVIFLLSLWVKLSWAQENIHTESSSATTYIIIGLILLVTVIVMLVNRQKRKYND